jgi:hypothetical protein
MLGRDVKRRIRSKETKNGAKNQKLHENVF